MDDFRVELEVDVEKLVKKSPSALKRLAASYATAGGEPLVIVNSADLQVCLALASLYLEKR